MIGWRSGRRAASFGALVALLVVPPGLALGGEDEEGPSAFCDYVDAGDPGTSGNLLAVTVLGDGLGFGFDALNVPVRIRVAKAHGRIRVRAPEGEVQCEGRRPTVTNVDRLRIVTSSDGAALLDLGGAPFAPGATDEGGRGSEIEIALVGEYGYLFIRGGPGPTRLVVQSTDAEGHLGVNLNSHLDGRDDDFDVTADDETALVLLGGRGADSLVGLAPEDPGDALHGPIGFAFLFGGPGNDSLRQFAGLGVGGRGNDVLRGGASSSYLVGRGGNDTLIGGAGPDYLEGGNGEDDFHGGAQRDQLVARDGRAERVDCGPGDDRLNSFDHGDGHRSCERRRRGERGQGLFQKRETPGKRAILAVPSA